MIVVMRMIAGRETQNNGILKMLASAVAERPPFSGKILVLMFSVHGNVVFPSRCS